MDVGHRRSRLSNSPCKSGAPPPQSPLSAAARSASEQRWCCAINSSAAHCACLPATKSVGARMCTAQQETQRFHLGRFEQPTKGGESIQSREHGFDLAGDLQRLFTLCHLNTKFADRWVSDILIALMAEIAAIFPSSRRPSTAYLYALLSLCHTTATVWKTAVFEKRNYPRADSNRRPTD